MRLQEVPSCTAQRSASIVQRRQANGAATTIGFPAGSARGPECRGRQGLLWVEDEGGVVFWGSGFRGPVCRSFGGLSLDLKVRGLGYRGWRFRVWGAAWIPGQSGLVEVLLLQVPLSGLDTEACTLLGVYVKPYV